MVGKLWSKSWIDITSWQITNPQEYPIIKTDSLKTTWNSHFIIHKLFLTDMSIFHITSFTWRFKDPQTSLFLPRERSQRTRKYTIAFLFLFSSFLGCSMFLLVSVLCMLSVDFKTEQECGRHWTCFKCQSLNNKVKLRRTLLVSGHWVALESSCRFATTGLISFLSVELFYLPRIKCG